MRTIMTLGHPAKRTRFRYSGSVKRGAILHFDIKTKISPVFFAAILEHFKGQTVHGGFNMTDPTPNGLGI
jgi:hypothetical protein